MSQGWWSRAKLSEEGGNHGNPEAATTQTSEYMVLEKEGPADGERGTSDSKNPKHQAPTHLRARLTLTKSSGRTLQSKPGCNTSPGKLFAYSQTVAWVKKELARTTIKPDDWTDQRAPRKGF